MEKEIILRVKSFQKMKDEEPFEMDLYTECKYIEKEDVIELVYWENEMMGPKSKVILTIADESLCMKRSGEVETKMTFEVGKRETSIYKTPYGDFKIELLTDSLDIDISRNHGSINVEYTVSLSGSPEIKNTLNVSY